MCKGLKLIFGGLIILLLCITVDLVSIYTINKPIFAIKGNNDNHYYGLFYDTYNCLEYSSPQIKFKGSKFSCLVDFEILEQHAYTVSVDETFNCSGNKDLYLGLENQNVYTYCLDNIRVVVGNDIMELKDYYKENNRIIDEIINSLDYVDTYKDGGSKLYRDNGDDGFTDNGLSIIKCNTVAGNKDIYIGPLNMEYRDDFCKYDLNMREYID